MSKVLSILREFLEELNIPEKTIDELMEFFGNIKLLIETENAFVDPFLRKELKALLITSNKEQVNLILQALSETLKISTRIISLGDDLQNIDNVLNKLSVMDTSEFKKNKINEILVITNIDEAFNENISNESLKKQEKYLDLLNFWKNKFSSTTGVIGIIRSPFLLKDEIEWWGRKIFLKSASKLSLSNLLKKKGLPFQSSDINNILEAAEGINYSEFAEIIDMAWNMEFSSLKSFISYLDDYPKEYSISEIIEIEKLLN